ncbi:MFS transporter [Ktedonosporobacter rubrisoli]|uniref:MFS transporter n=1 Tax=Ktedonosporobacter rubrisoli TaxID=2509675 RepID=A0A4P6JL04_KTERU|nr:MFS transporter [Ktedonosporobacter rubrisoli]QBD75662.1 MFS transporter [Ktedonosporobacter rubrisoli]
MSNRNQGLRHSTRSGWALALLACSQAIISIDISIVYIALPSIGKSLGFSAHDLQWVVNAYALIFGGFLLLGGRMADLLGRRRMFTIAAALYAVSSLVGGLSPTPELLIIARGVQGLGGALLFPATLSNVNTVFAEGRERNRALSIWSAAGGSGLSVGTLLGGVLTSALGWQWTFFVNVPFALLLALAAPLLLPRDTNKPISARSFDLPGAIISTAASLLLVYGLTEGTAIGWTSPTTLTIIFVALLLFAIFILIEARTRTPLMPLRLLRNRSLVASMLMTAIFMGTFGVQPYLLTIWLQQVHHASALEAGLVSLPLSLAVMIGTNIGGRLSTRLGTRTTIIIGMAIGIVMFILLAFQLNPDGPYLINLLPCGIIAGLGQGITWTAMWIAAASGIPAQEQGVASGMASTTQQVGSAIGLAVFEAIANAGAKGLTGNTMLSALNHGIQNAFLIAAGPMLIGIVLAAILMHALKHKSGQLQAAEPGSSAEEILGKQVLP